jgi:hypothetical protein
MTAAQRDLLHLLDTARSDLLAGRPAHGVRNALHGALSGNEFRDPHADDKRWRGRVGIATLTEKSRPDGWR